ncbi:PREDICTED: RING-H2 finger protein ATL70-like [Nicotiana attenuata]|uniref:RING-H2 finger protein ATL70-like n=1 Tax=Nicotiana attenuata TaxID=49451 RepID=UPI00090481E2|nr:PREDICTED: RING-H2 finger protein ATL70-like [Nicotiana attenuata]
MAEEEEERGKGAGASIGRAESQKATIYFSRRFPDPSDSDHDFISSDERKKKKTRKIAEEEIVSIHNASEEVKVPELNLASTRCNEDVQEVVVEVGLDEETLLSYPKLLYSEAKVNHKDSTATCCSICLADYKNSDMLRLLPDCGHLFHLKCVDPWLRLNPTCPVCRTSPLPIPQTTPLAEVVQGFCSTANSPEIRVCS